MNKSLFKVSKAFIYLTIMSGCFRIKDINQVVEKMSMKYTYEAI